MESFFWQLANRTPETQFIFNLFHFLLAGLTLLVLLRQLGPNRTKNVQLPDRLFTVEILSPPEMRNNSTSRLPFYHIENFFGMVRSGCMKIMRRYF